MQSALLTVPETERRLVLDRYEPVRHLGSGGFGTVWLARDLKLGRMVALKRIGMTDAQVAQRARRESLAAARLSHPAIVALYEAVADDDAVYLVTEHVRGRTLADRIHDGSLSDLDVLEIGIVLCDALAHAHKRGVVHRDVKPHNVIIPDAAAGDGSTTAKLTDFGIAQLNDADALTATGDVVGTLAYMAPEQADGNAVTPASDLYSLGLCLYEALTGVNPVRGRGAAATARQVGRRLPRLNQLRRDLPETLGGAIDTAVRADPATRGTLRDLRTALVECLPAATDQAGAVDGPVPSGVEQDEASGTDRHRLRGRLIAGVSSAALIYAALSMLGPDPPFDVAALSAAGCVCVFLFPRVGWILAAAACVVWMATEGQLGIALLLATALVPVPLLLARAGAAWSAPAAAAFLGAAAVSGLFPVIAGQLHRGWDRFALGALGAWWLLLAEPVAGVRLLTGERVDGSGWRDSPVEAAREVVAPIVSSPEMGLAVVWGLAALLLPLIVRGRNLAADVVAATVWVATTASATQALCGTSVHGLIPTAILTGSVAIALAVLRPRV